MAANPRMVTQDRQISWDGVSQRLPKGQVLDVPPDSALEREIGSQYLVPMPGAVVQEPVQAPAEEAAPREAAAPVALSKPRPAAKSGDGKGGEP